MLCYLQRVWFDITSTLCILAVSVAFPEAAFGLSMMKALITASPDSVSGADAFAQKAGSKLALNGVQDIGISAAKYLLESNAIKTEIQAANYKAQMDWFGGCCIYTNENGSDSEKDIMVNVGINDPAVLRAMYQWQYGGIETITGWDGTEIDWLIAETKKYK